MGHPRLCGVKLHYSHYSHPIWIDPRLRGVKVVIMKENAFDAIIKVDTER